MNRIRFGAALLAVLLLAGLWTARDMSRRSEDVAARLDTAARQALEADFPAALQTAAGAELLWQDHWGINAALADHAPLEQVDMGFAQLAVFGKSDDWISFAALCAQLAQQIRAIGESTGAGWKNIL